MALVTSRVSDLTGKPGKDEDFVSVVVRSGAGVEKPVIFDALKGEVSSLKNAADLVELEIRTNGDTQRVVVTQEVFNALSKDMPSVLENARSLRGREPINRR